MRRVEENTPLEKRLLGTVSVDSGQIFMCDPCYLLPDSGTGITMDESSYTTICDATCSTKGAGPVFRNLAVAFSTGADGGYKVFGYYLAGHRSPRRIEIEIGG